MMPYLCPRAQQILHDTTFRPIALGLKRVQVYPYGQTQIPYARILVGGAHLFLNVSTPLSNPL
jgi:hypothetical protein